MNEFPWVSVIIAATVLLALSLGFMWLLRAKAIERDRIAALSPAERAAHEALLAAKAEYKDALQEYRRRVATAEKEHQRERKSISARLDLAVKQMKQAEETGRKKLGTCTGKDGSVTLFEHQIHIKGKTFPLEASVSASVDTTGVLSRTSRSTLTRMAAGGALMGPVGLLAGGMVKKKKVHDDRELYLMIEADSFAAVITCDPANAVRVRQFAASVSNAAKNVETAHAEHEKAVSQAKPHLTTVQANVPQLNMANDAKLKAVNADNKRLVSAEALLTSLGAPPKK